jgi:hypothetical protein
VTQSIPDEEELYSLPLTDLLRMAAEADGQTRIAYRDPIASYGEEAIDAVKPWLSDARLNLFAGVVLRRVGELGGNAAARKALLDAQARAGVPLREFIDEQLRLLEGLPPRPEDPPRNTSLTPIGSYAGVHHIVRDYLPTSSVRSKDVFLLECGRYFSNAWVTAHGGILRAASGATCPLCITRHMRGER